MNYYFEMFDTNNYTIFLIKDTVFKEQSVEKYIKYLETKWHDRQYSRIKYKNIFSVHRVFNSFTSFISTATLFNNNEINYDIVNIFNKFELLTILEHFIKNKFRLNVWSQNLELANYCIENIDKIINDATIKSIIE